MRKPEPDVRFDDEPPPRTPAPKDKQRWCGGRVGRNHTPRLTIPPNRPDDAGICRTVPEWYRKTPAFRDDSLAWWCYHVLICSKCGRHIRPARRGECPDGPTPPPSSAPAAVAS